MNRLHRYIPLLLLAGLGLFAVGCNDNDECPTCPDDESGAFEITVTCVDDEGRPLANVAVGGMSALPERFWPFFPNGFLEKSRVGLRFQLMDSLLVKVLIRDVERNLVKTILESNLLAGDWEAMWDGRYADNGIQAPAGYYEALLMINEGEGIGWAAVDSIGLFQAAIDVGQFCYGATNAEGKIRLTDRRMVPAFFDLLPIAGTNENADQLGLVPMTTTTWLNCQSQDNRSGWGVFDAVDGPQEITVVLTAEAEDPAGSTARLPAAPQARSKDARAAFRGAYPNPFN